MRLLALVTDAYGSGGGIAQYNRDLLDGLSGCSCITEVHLLARNGLLVPDQLPAKIAQLAIARGKFAFAWNALLATRHLTKADVIFCGHLFTLPLALLLSRLSGAAIWLQLHGIEAWQPTGWIGRYAVAQVQLVTVVSRYTRMRFLAWANCNPRLVKVLPNTVSEKFAPVPVTSSLREQYGVVGKKVLLTVSRLAASERYKGHEQVMEALQVAELASLPWVYLVAGDGDDRMRLQKVAATAGLGERVKFIGFVSDDDLPTLFCLADVFVMPSSGEGFGIVFLQALASGCPVIAADADGSRDPLRDGSAGVLVSLKEPTELANALLRVLTGNEGRADAEPVFARPNFISQVQRLLQTLQVAAERCV